MCGIAGWIDLEANISSNCRIVELMADKLTNRGPDASGIWASEHALIGHRRLVVVDPAGGGQPMIREFSGNKYVLTYNGELYNTVELRKELILKGHYFQSTSDTEVLLISYVEWGKSCIEHLNGIFAFGIWDEKEQSLFLGRDRFGVKPLFYAQRNSSIIFASELKSLLMHPYIKAEVSYEGLAEIFALGPARTPGHGVFKDVNEVKPAHSIVYDRYGIHAHRYWALESHPHTDNLETTITKVRDLVKDSIERQLVADVPVCTFLSGGLDSSAITSIAATHFKNTGSGQLHTFSIDYVDNEKFFKPSSFQPNSDAYFVKRMSQEFQTHHHYITVDTPQLTDALIASTHARDLPGMADIDSSLLLFCREIKKSHVVSLSGECADEVFGGYPWFHKEDALAADTFPWSRSMEERTRVYSKELLDLIRPTEYVARRYHETLDEVPRLSGEDKLEARRREMFYLNINWFMSTLLDRKDRMSMASGLEVRVPYCDHRIVEYVWNIPWSMKMLDGREKGILRRALEGFLPEDILYRKKSPYPKTHNPAYETIVKQRVLEIINDNSSPLLPFVDCDAIYSLAEQDSDYGKPWFGQLMATPQMFAYLIQVDTWLRDYHVRLV
jgi:asparagine synthase (glutamine-hydrolysing)